MRSYFVENFGCRATQADGASLERQFEERGLMRAATSAQAELVVLNTCTVTAAADQDARAAVRRVRRQNPEAKIVVTGCYAQRAPQEVAALPGVSFVIGNSHKHQLAAIALSEEREARTASSPRLNGHEALAGEVPASSKPSFLPVDVLTANWPPATDNRIFVSDIFAHTELLAAPVFEAAGFSERERTRPNLKVQDGCDNRCSFCVIPYVRGESRSLRVEQVLEEVNALVAAGYREVVISGINLGRWGRDLEDGFRHPASGVHSKDAGPNNQVQKPAFESLLRAILDHTSIEKLRISSVEPMDWTDDLIALVATSPRIAKHAHVPMQSGSDAVLRRMHRKYRPWHYREKIEKIRAAMPTAAIGADVMVGFPGETDAEFEATRRMIEDLPFTYLHVFTYSPRPGTAAAAMPNQVPVQVAHERNRILRNLAAEKKQTFMRSFVGQTVDAITLNAVHERNDGPCTEALTDNYLQLRLRGRHEPNRWLRARIQNAIDGALVGEVTDPAFDEAR